MLGFLLCQLLEKTVLLFIFLIYGKIYESKRKSHEWEEFDHVDFETLQLLSRGHKES